MALEPLSLYSLPLASPTSRSDIAGFAATLLVETSALAAGAT